MNTLSVVIITYNEEAKIGRCLDSVKNIADEIIVVDSESTDNTEGICRKYDVRFVRQKWLGYAEQKNFANNLAQSDYILSIDADEALSEKLCHSISAIKAEPHENNMVFAMNRLNNYCGRWIRRCGLYPDTKVRIWRRGFAHWEGLIHETLCYESHPKIVKLAGDLLHYSFDSPEGFEKQMFHFADLGGRSYFERNKKTSMIHWLFSPSFDFFRNYIIKGGCLEGRTGWHICRTLSRATRHKYNTLRLLLKEAKQKKDRNDDHI